MVAFRFVPPLVAALVWHLALVGERHLVTGACTASSSAPNGGATRAATMPAAVRMPTVSAPPTGASRPRATAR